MLGFLSLSYLLVGLVALWVRIKEVDVVLFAESYPSLRGETYHDALHQRRDQAWSQIRWSFFWCCLVLGYVHAYDHERRAILASRDAALAMQAPFGCLKPGDWQTLGWAQTAQFTLYPAWPEQSCASYLERTNVSPWPNPFLVLTETLLAAPLRTMERVTDSLASSLHSFLGHFSWALQTYFVLLLPCCTVALLWAWPLLRAWARAVRACSPSSKQL